MNILNLFKNNSSETFVPKRIISESSKIVVPKPQLQTLKIGLMFNKNDLRNFFLTETIYKNSLQPFGFYLQKFSQISDTELCFIFKRSEKNSIDEPLQKVLNCIPPLLDISKYGWSFDLNMDYILEDISKYKDTIQWDYRHGICNVKI